MSAPTAVDNVSWDIETLIPTPGREGVTQLFDRADALATELEEVRGTLAECDAGELAAVFDRLAALSDLVGRAANYSMLAFSVATDDPEVGALMQFAQERATAITTRLVFVELELADLPDDRADELVADPRLASVAHHLEGLRRFRPHLLSEAEEIVINEKAVTGSSAWSRLFDEQCSVITVDGPEGPVPLDLALSGLQAADADERAATAAAITEALDPGLRTRGYIFNTLLADKSTDDRLRSYDGWIQSRNLANEASDESVQALVDAVVARYSIPQRWYTAKAGLLGLDRLKDWDRMAPVVTDETSFGWEEATETVLDAYASFSPVMADVARKFFDEPWIDAPLRPGKRGGAFCAYTVPDHHPYVLLNWTDRRRDVLTLAHELGHGIHAHLARPQGIFQQTTPLTLAETASVFGETVTFNRLLEPLDDPADRLPLLAENLEDQIATVFRQIAMNRFEGAVHRERRTVGELSIERFGELWAESQVEMLGDSVDVTAGYRTWWSYIPHFIHTPGYVYAYAYGQLLALSIYARYRVEGPGFVDSYVDMLAAGGSRSPEDLAAMVGVDLADPGFWDGGLDIIESVLDATIDAATAAGRLT